MIYSDMASALAGGAMATALLWLVFVIAVAIGLTWAVTRSDKRGKDFKRLPADPWVRKDRSTNLGSKEMQSRQREK